MMAVVLKPFKCKLTKNRYVPGQAYKGTPERIAELQGAGYLEGAPPLNLADPKNDESLTVAETNKYQLMTKKELGEVLSQRGIEFSLRQTKAELIDLLIG